jgi:hypothetical protein
MEKDPVIVRSGWNSGFSSFVISRAAGRGDSPGRATFVCNPVPTLTRMSKLDGGKGGWRSFSDGGAAPSGSPAIQIQILVDRSAGEHSPMPQRADHAVIERTVRDQRISDPTGPGLHRRGR